MQVINKLHSLYVIVLLMFCVLNGFAQSPGIVPAEQNVACGGYPSQLQANVSHLPIGVALQWQRSSNGTSGWTNISQATGSTYTPTITVATTYFRLRAVYSGNTYYSNTAVVTVNPNPLSIGKASPESQLVLYNTAPHFLNAGFISGGSCAEDYTYQWQAATLSNTNFQDIVATGADQTMFTPPAITENTWYRLKVEVNGQTAYSDVIEAKLTAALSGGTIATNNNVITYNNAPVINSVWGANGGIVAHIYQWQVSVNNGTTWTDISGAGDVNYPASGGNITASCLIRRKVTCSSEVAYSNVLGFSVDNITTNVPVPPNDPADDITLNWTFVRTYNPDGTVIGESKSFFDAAGKLLQSQTKSFAIDNDVSKQHVFAAQPVYDALGRPAVSTMTAPINNRSFKYKPDFVGGYNYNNFDDSKTNNPDAVTNSGVGSLGWFYSTANTWEPYTSTTAFPYSRQSFYADGTGNIKKIAGIGDVHKMGTGRETGSFITPVVNELNNYLQVRDRFFSVAEVGGEPATLKSQAIQIASRDANGNEVVIIQDKGGKMLMTGRPGNDVTVSNTVLLKGYWYVYEYNGGGVDWINNIVIKGTGNGKVYVEGSLVYTGNLALYTPPVTNTLVLKIESDQFFTVNHGSRLNTTTGWPINPCNECRPATVPVTHYFKILNNNTPVTVTGGTWQLLDMTTEQAASLLGVGAGTYLNKGYYKLIALTEDVSLTYQSGYTDVSYNFYNQLGQLAASISPEGVKQLINPAGAGNCPFNSLPVIVAPSIKTMQHSTQQTVLVSVTDADVDPLTITFSSPLPAFATVSTPANGQRLLTFNPSAAQQGTYTITVNVADGVNQIVSKSITLIVNSGANQPPQITPIADFGSRWGRTFTQPVTAVDPDGEAITLTFDNLPYFINVNNIGNGQSELVAMPSIGEQGTYGLTVHATDARGAESELTFFWVINNNNAPVINPVNDVCAIKGQTVSVNLTGDDADGPSELSWTAEGLPSFATLVDNGNGAAVLQVSPGLTDAGRYEVLLTLKDYYTPITRKIFITAGGTAVTDKAQAPFMTLYEYDVQGRRIKTRSPDGGINEIVYRTDGKVRFSQNAEQKKTNRYSYTNYDVLGRPIESGEYQPDAGGIAFTSDLSTSSPMKSILENTNSTGGLTTGTKKDVIITKYDVADNSHGVPGYEQEAIYLVGTVSVTQKYSSIVNNTPNSADLVSGTWYNYDEEGRVTWQIQYIAGLGYKTTNYTFNSVGLLVKKAYQQGSADERFFHYYEYTPGNKLWQVYTNTVDDRATASLQATYSYYMQGGLKRVELATDLQGIDYTYTLQGALKAINNSDATRDPGGDGGNGFSTDAFGMVLDYYAGDYTNARAGIQLVNGVNTAAITTDSYAGNIKAMTWFSKKPQTTPDRQAMEAPTSYVYKYDDKYQFTESTWGTGINFPATANTPASFTATAFNKEIIKHPSNGLSAYDANGNIQYLQRTGGTGTIADKLTYSYQSNTNRLQNVVNEALGSPQLHAGYEYDALGQLTGENSGDPVKRKYIKYDVTGKVILVARDAPFFQKVVEYVYNELGQRIIKKTYNSSSQLIQVTYYAGDVIYTQAITGGVGGAIVAAEYEIGGGSGRIGTYYRPENIYAYELNDHLGNVRAVVAKSGSSLDVRMYTDYYPFGMALRRFGSGYRYEYQGQHAEKDGETDWNAFELRMYDSKIARWLSVDPYGEYWSPYVGMGNDPVNNVDPDGGCAECKANEFAKGFAGATVTALSKGRYSVSYTGDDGIAHAKIFKPGYFASAWIGFKDWYKSAYAHAQEQRREAFRNPIKFWWNNMSIYGVAKKVPQTIYDNNIFVQSYKSYTENFVPLMQGDYNTAGYNAGQKAAPATLQLGVSLIVPLARSTGSFFRTSSAGIVTFTEEYTISVYHKGNLNGGTVSSVRSLSTGLERASVEALERPGQVWEFKIPQSVYNKWYYEGVITLYRDVDKVTGALNQEVRFSPVVAPQMNQYLVK